MLCVAEKPKVAKTAARILASDERVEFMPSASMYNPNFIFKAKFLGEEIKVFFTSILGHLTDIDFATDTSNWKEVDPFSLFRTEIKENFINDEKTSNVISNIQSKAKDCRILFLWLDNDREGEFISEEVEKVCKSVNPNIVVYRARFSALSKSDVTHAFNNPTAINRSMADAARLRRELDLRTGCVFTRLQTMNLRGILSDGKEKITYGPCQTPTLGFVVDAYNRNRMFKSEEFYKINVKIEKDLISYDLKWNRKQLFCKISSFALYASVMANQKGSVEDCLEYETTIEPVLPLTTIELQKKSFDYFKIKSSETMKIAERLYSDGFISYPRTETDIFPDDFDYDKILNELTNYGTFSINAKELLTAKFVAKRGTHTDNAHQPIYPMALPSTFSDEKEKQVFELICWNFLACISSNAEVISSKVIFNIGGERFHLKGKRVQNPGWYSDYPYEKLQSVEIPKFEKNEEIKIVSITFDKGESTAPPLLNESALLDSMFKSGIGTDATFQDHIMNIKNNNLASETLDGSYEPSPLGIALASGYENIGLNFAKPVLRAELERALNDVEEGKKKIDDVREEFITKYENEYKKFRNDMDVLVSTFKAQKYLLESQNKKQ